jgi:glucose-1-phosphate adenylyltransferase
MERSRIGRNAQVHRAIIDQDNDVPAGERIGFDLEHDRKRFHVTESGIVVVPAGYFRAGNKHHAHPAARPAVRTGKGRLEVVA